MSTNVLVNNSATTKCYDVDELFGKDIGDNFSLDEKKAYSCSQNLIWAKETGIKDHPEYYVNYSLTENSSWADYQCALYQAKGTDEAGTGWNCTYPCTSTLPQCPQPGSKELPTPPPTAFPTNETETEAGSGGSGSSGLPWWAWLLIGLALAACLGGLAFMMMNKKEPPKKKKRATKKPTPTPAPAPEPAPAPAPAPAVEPYLVSPPVYVTSAAPVPTTMTAQPIYTAAPAVSMPTAMPIQTVAAPIQMAAPVYQAASAAVPVSAGYYA